MGIVSGRIWVVDGSISAHSVCYKLLLDEILQELDLFLPTQLYGQRRHKFTGEAAVLCGFSFLHSVPPVSYTHLANLFFGTGIPVCVLVLKRERNDNADNILFIDASGDFEAGKNQNILRECDIDKIVETYERREDVDKYAHVATMQEIAENGFNLNIPRYVDTFEPEEEIDLNQVAAEIRQLQNEIKGIDAELKPFFDELGLDFPFEVEGE